ncbi:Sulfhydryl oxidase 1 [Diplonema papillatum]|nr:Sulfhydryl oxidase 1 [Diplonema papillatum]|eukprot:gene20017-30806_t
MRAAAVLAAAFAGAAAADVDMGKPAEGVIPLDRLPWQGEAVPAEFSVPACPWVVEFYHPECGGCQRLAAPFHRVAKRIHDENLPCVIGAIDCKVNMQYCLASGANSFPHVTGWARDRSAAPAVMPDTEGTDDELEAVLDAFFRKVCTAASPAAADNCRPAALARYQTAASLSKSGDADPPPALVYRGEAVTADNVYLPDVVNALHSALACPQVVSGVTSDAKAALMVLASHAFPDQSLRTALSKSMRENPHLPPATLIKETILPIIADHGEGVLKGNPGTRVYTWFGCAGSARGYRGLPCALWQLFHVLTVRCLGGYCPEDQDPLQVMRAWVVAHFNCKECRQNFLHATMRWGTGALSRRGAVVALWELHNEVNERLKGQASEDPLHPKGFFPYPGATEAQAVAALTELYAKEQLGGSEPTFAARVHDPSGPALTPAWLLVAGVVLALVAHFWRKLTRHRNKRSF